MHQTALDSASLRVKAEQIASAYLPNGGRPALVSDADKVQVFLASLSDGNYRETACKMAGIAKQTLYNALKRAEAGDEASKAFVDAMENAEAQAESETVKNVRNASKQPQFWAAGMTWLERKSPDKWGRRNEDSGSPRVVVQIGVQASDVQLTSVNVISNYQTRTDDVALSSQSLTDTPFGAFAPETVERKPVAEAKGDAAQAGVVTGEGQRRAISPGTQPGAAATTRRGTVRGQRRSGGGAERKRACGDS